jgi:hypothetical protein
LKRLQDKTANQELLTLAKKSVVDYWKEQAKKNLPFFVEDVLGYENAPHQTEWLSVLGNKSYKKIVFAAPRGHTKSTCASINYPLWEISNNPNIRILLVSSSESASQAFLREVVGHIERDKFFNEFNGNLKPQMPEKWTAREIIITRSDLSLKDPSISTVGVGGTILSKRADVIICDDILNPENTKTYEQRIKMREWFHQVLLPVLVPNGRIIVVGTVWDQDDLLHELLKDASYDYRKKFKAVIEPPTHKELWDNWYAIRMKGTEESKLEADKYKAENKEKMYEGIKTLWQYFDYEMLYLLERTSKVSFEKAYQNNIISREDQKFKEEWIARAKERGKNFRLIKSMTPDLRKEFKSLTAGIDLQASEKAQADDNVLLSMGEMRLDNLIYLLNIERGKPSPAEWRKLIVQKDRDDGFRHDKILVETNGYQNALKRDMDQYNLPIEAFTTTGEKFDPYIGVESLAILFENDRIVLPYDNTDPETIAKVDQLVDELRKFPSGHTGDSVMAFWFAYTAMRSLVDVQQDGFLKMIQNDIAKAKTGNNINSWLNMAKNGGQKL